jgi:hypothetical protein
MPMQGPEFLADEDFYSNCTQVRDNATGPDGTAHYELLIPEAVYRIYRSGQGGPEVAAEFTVRSGEARDLGEITVKIDK